MFRKFLKHEFKAIVDCICELFCFIFDAYWCIFKCGLIIVMIIIPLICLIEKLPMWVLCLEVIGIVIFNLYKKYLAFRIELKNENEEED